MSPRAAWRLESKGFRRVYDYGGGKQNWLAAGLPTEGKLEDEVRARDVARDDVATCALEDRVGDAAERAKRDGWEACVVVNEGRVVLGLLRREELFESDPDARVETVMRPGPSTFRPHVGILEMAKYMVEHDLVSTPITTGEGVLVGLLLREDALRVARELHERAHARGHDDE
jgi:predicted transcriptional regulator